MSDIDGFFTLIILQFLFYSLTNPLAGGLGGCWGPRFVFEVVPFTILLCAPVFETIHKKKWLRMMVGLAAFFSFLVQFESVLVNYNRIYTQLRMEHVPFTFEHPYTGGAFKNSLIVRQLERLLVIHG